MSALGARTKKVTTYGSKKSKVINIHYDVTPDRARDKPKPKAAPSSPLSRPPLQAKMSYSDDICTPLKVSKTTKSKATKSVAAGRRRASPMKENGLAAHPVPRARKVVQPRSPQAQPVPTPRGNRVEVVIPASAKMMRMLRDVGPATPSRTPAVKNKGLVERMAAVCLEDVPKEKARDKLKLKEKGKAVAEPRAPQATTTEQLSGVDALLACCTTSCVQSFDGIFAAPEFLRLLPGSSKASTAVIHKLGEASYSEVFTAASLEEGATIVVKVIPLLAGEPHQSSPSSSKSGKSKASDDDNEIPDCSEAADVLRELEITRRMAGVPGGGFVDFLGAFVIEGAYPQPLVKEWDAYKAQHGSDNIRPATFPTTQQYVLLVLSNSGTDLESSKLDGARGWVHAASVFWQVADALARAEKWTQFEHRDLHEGQILVSTNDEHPSPAPVTDYLDTAETGASATIIDFGLSRLDMAGVGPTFNALPEEVYDGVGDQWDVYRSQRAHIALTSLGEWSAFHPRTNVLWLQYLASHLLSTKRKPYARRAGAVPSASVMAAGGPAAVKEGLRRQAEAAWGLLSEMKGVLGDKKVKSAGDVVQIGRVREWIS